MARAHLRAAETCDDALASEFWATVGASVGFGTLDEFGWDATVGSPHLSRANHEHSDCDFGATIIASEMSAIALGGGGALAFRLGGATALANVGLSPTLGCEVGCAMSVGLYGGVGAIVPLVWRLGARLDAKVHTYGRPSRRGRRMYAVEVGIAMLPD